MGTRSLIGKVQDDGSILAVYCHWDGYPSNNGRILLEHYQDPRKVDQLIDLGNLSSLGENLGEKHDFDNRPEGVCTFYGRDRGETDTQATRFENQADFWKAEGWMGIEFVYLRENGEWWVGKGDGDFRELTLEMTVEAD